MNMPVVDGFGVANSSDTRQLTGVYLSHAYMWRIPVYQRHYSWRYTDDGYGSVDLFWETVGEQAEARLTEQTDNPPSPHYMGAILVEKVGHDVSTNTTHYDVVDGQQRLTTIQVALLAAARAADKLGHGGEIVKDVEKFIFSQGRTPRVRPTNFDFAQFQAILYDVFKTEFAHFGLGVLVDDVNVHKSNVAKNYIFFVEKFRTFAEKMAEKNGVRTVDAIRAIVKTLTEGLDIVLIVLREYDDAQSVFESLNNTGTPLSTFDLIRNNVFSRAEKAAPGQKADEALFMSPTWQALEDPFWSGESNPSARKIKKTHIEAYVEQSIMASVSEVFEFNRNATYKAYKGKFSPLFASVEEEVAQLARHTGVYRHLFEGEGVDPSTKVDYGIFRWANWSSRMLYPVLFVIAASEASAEEKQKMINLLESYVVRRAIAETKEINTKAYARNAVTFCRELGRSVTLGNLNEIVKRSSDTSIVFPKDTLVKENCVWANFYSCPFPHYVLRTMFSHGEDSHEIGELMNLTVDHLIPKEWAKNPAWASALDGVAETEVASVMNTIGNLTLVSRSKNAKKGNRSWENARELLGDSPIKMNRELAHEETWDVKKITARSRALAAKICEIWPYDIA